jgi:PAS domain S-box-containing protein
VTAVEIGALESAYRRTNALRITATMALLSLAALPVAFALHSRPGVLLLMSLNLLAVTSSYLILRYGADTPRSTVAAILLVLASQMTEYVGATWIEGELGPLPYLVPLLVLLTAATLPSRWLWFALVASLVTTSTQGWLSPGTTQDQGAIAVADVLTIITFVVSMLHVRGTEGAFKLAATRDRERAEAAARAVESETLVGLIAENTDDLISLVATDGKPLYLSPSFARVFGETVESLGSSPPLQRVATETREKLAGLFERCLADGQARDEIELRLPNKERTILDCHMHRVTGPMGTLVSAISRDVTGRKLLEQRLQAAERLETLGRLAGSVAHDFNNLLMVIGGAAEMAQLALSDSDPASEDVRTVLSATSSASQLTQQLLTFSRNQLVIPTQLDVATSLNGQRDILTRMVGRRIQLEFDLPEGLPMVHMASCHLEQLAMNLAVNARDAMANGGRVRFGLRKRALVNGQIEHLTAGDYIELSVQDEGTGIADEVLPHLFDPFFSTKGDGGTGLGLATCHTIVTRLKGTITVETALGKGTTFRVLLPVSSRDVRPVTIAKPTESVRRVLVIDDEEAVRDMTARMLRSSGFDVRTASNLTEAREIILCDTIELEAVLTDIVLSGERGTELLAWTRSIRPKMRIVVMSGYAPEPQSMRSLIEHDAEFLPKPFGMDQLLRALGGPKSSATHAAT